MLAADRARAWTTWAAPRFWPDGGGSGLSVQTGCSDRLPGATPGRTATSTSIDFTPGREPSLLALAAMKEDLAARTAMKPRVAEATAGEMVRVF